MAKMSENSVKLLDFLKANTDKKMTADEVAAATGLAKATITGAFTAFQKKGLGIREEGTVNGEVEVSFLTVTDEGKSADTSELSENAQAIIAHLIATDNAPATLDDVATAISVDKRKVNGAFNALVKKGLCARVPATIEAPVTVKYLVLTDDGIAYDPTSDAE
jgi:predicted transcriptional regulator